MKNTNHKINRISLRYEKHHDIFMKYILGLDRLANLRYNCQKIISQNTLHSRITKLSTICTNPMAKAMPLKDKLKLGAVSPILQEREEIKMNNSAFNVSDLYTLTGVKGLKNLAITRAIGYGTRKIKYNFGLDMTFTQPSQINAVTDWIRERDNKFKDHISNPYSLNTHISGECPILNGEFILKLDKATYLFCKATSEKSRENNSPDNRSVYLYFFGKKMYKHFMILKRYIDDKAASANMMYSITAQKGEGRNSSFWTCIGSDLVPRNMDTLYFDNSIKQTIIDHLDKWLANEDIYKQRGLTFKTGILLHGTKGTGKSSLATAIATYLKCGLINIDCTTFQDLNIADVTESINADNERYVILLDEVDSLFISRDGDDADTKKERTAKLLGFLDGPNSPTNVVFVLTTNYKDRLDEAAIREGRVDLDIELLDISEKTARDMCHDFELSEKQISEIFKDITFPVNPAALQTKILYSLSDSLL